jgi:predicted lipoprotein
MTTAADIEKTAAAPSRRISARVIGVGLLVLVVAAMAVDTTYKKPGEVTASGRKAFDPAQYGATTFPKVVAAVGKSAVPIGELVPALAKDQEAASKQFGKRQGSSPYNFATTGEGVAGKATNGIMPVKVDGIPKDVQVSLQVGPAINGTALRDVVGFINFGQFTNQVEYAGSATALNTQVKEKVLKGIDAASLAGKRVSFVGAFTLLVPTAVTITPIKLETVG